MPFIPSFTATQLYATPNILRIVDTSTGSDIDINDRQIYLRKADGTYLVPQGTKTNYISWLYDDGNVIDINVLNIDYCLEIKIDWGISPSSNISTESKIDIITENNIKIETQ